MGKNIFLYCIILSSLLHAQQREYARFIKRDYDPVLYDISINTYKHGEVLVKIIKVNKKKHIVSDKTWLEIYKSNKKLYENYYDESDFDAENGGLFVPKIQPPPPWFAVVKLGSYHGILYLINTKGVVRELIGGSYYISKDSRYLFSEYRSDTSGIAVFDLNEGRQLISSKDVPWCHQWYIINNEYFFTASIYEDSTHEWIERRDEGYFFNTQKMIFIKRNINNALLRNADKVAYCFKPDRDTR
jgi:hypothetical protein